MPRLQFSFGKFLACKELKRLPKLTRTKQALETDAKKPHKLKLGKISQANKPHNHFPYFLLWGGGDWSGGEGTKYHVPFFALSIAIVGPSALPLKVL